MARRPLRTLALQGTPLPLLLGTLLLPLVVSVEVVKNTQEQNPISSPSIDLSITRPGSTIPKNAHQRAMYQRDAAVTQPALTCTAQCPRCPPVAPCPSPCAACSPCEKPVPPGYEHFPGLGLYRLHTAPLPWADAKATCEREGAHLAIINSQEEANLMKNLFNRDPKIGVVIHLGFHDLYQEGKYVTIFGKPLATTGYTKWDAGQPDNNGGNENCGSMFPSGGINDVNCASKWPFVCELPV